MNADGLPWLRMLMMLAIMAGMFGFPIITLTLDERRKKRDSDRQAAGEPLTTDAD